MECRNPCIGSKIILTHRAGPGMNKKRLSGWLEEQSRKLTAEQKMQDPVRKNHTHHAKLMWREYEADPEGYVDRLENGLINPVDGAVLDTDEKIDRVVESGVQRPGFLYKVTSAEYMVYPGSETAGYYPAPASPDHIDRQASAMDGRRYRHHRSAESGANQRQLSGRSKRRADLAAMHPNVSQYIGRSDQRSQSDITTARRYGLSQEPDEESNDLPAYPSADDGSCGDMLSGGMPPRGMRYFGTQGSSMQHGSMQHGSMHYGSMEGASMYGRQQLPFVEYDNGYTSLPYGLNATQQPSFMPYWPNQSLGNQMRGHETRMNHPPSNPSANSGNQKGQQRRENRAICFEDVADFNASSWYAALPGVSNTSLPVPPFGQSPNTRSENIGASTSNSHDGVAESTLVHNDLTVKSETGPYKRVILRKLNPDFNFSPPIQYLKSQNNLNRQDQSKARSGNKRKQHPTGIENTVDRGNKRQRHADTIVAESRINEAERMSSVPRNYSEPLSVPNLSSDSLQFTQFSFGADDFTDMAVPSFLFDPEPANVIPAQMPQFSQYLPTDTAQGMDVNVPQPENYNHDPMAAAGLQPGTYQSYNSTAQNSDFLDNKLAFEDLCRNIDPSLGFDVSPIAKVDPEEHEVPDAQGVQSPVIQEDPSFTSSQPLVFGDVEPENGTTLENGEVRVPTSNDIDLGSLHHNLAPEGLEGDGQHNGGQNDSQSSMVFPGNDGSISGSYTNFLNSDIDPQCFYQHQNLSMEAAPPGSPAFDSNMDHGVFDSDQNEFDAAIWDSTDFNVDDMYKEWP
jgi:hypothetical protein